jgi:hypothetical protein
MRIVPETIAMKRRPGLKTEDRRPMTQDRRAKTED